MSVTLSPRNAPDAPAPMLFLASASPRRRELLEQMGIAYRLLSIDVPEAPGPGEAAEAFALRLALEKARAGRALCPIDEPRPVLGADTVVVIGDRILGKPQDEAEGLATLELLSGATHRVLTAVALVGPAQWEATRLSVSLVTFRPTTAAEREAYWATGEPADKAGAYGIQGRGAVFVQRLEGSYSGVMGLPIFETAELLGAFGCQVHAGWPRAEGRYE